MAFARFLPPGIVEPMENTVIYTDGGCSGNPGPGGWAFVIVRSAAGGGLDSAVDGSRDSAGGESGSAKGSGGEKSTTNNRMELTAVCRGLEALMRLAGPAGRAGSAGPGGSAAGPGAGAVFGGRIGVYTDSQYVQKGITQWIASWERN